MAVNISQDDINVLSQRILNKYIRLEVLDFNYSVVNEISGVLTAMSVSVNADSDMRRSCSVSLVVNNSSFDLTPGGQVWLNRYIRPYVGYEYNQTGEILWYSQGIYLINAPTWDYDAMTNTLSFEGLDLMSKMTGTRNGQLLGVPTLIPMGNNVKEAMISTVTQLGGFTRYVIDECTNTDGEVQNVPYDIEISEGGYVYNLLAELRDILPNYQIYFDTEGVFYYNQIPSGENEPVLIDDTLLSQLEISESVNVDFTNVKNYIEVYGRTHEPQLYGTVTSVEEPGDGRYQIQLTLPTAVENIADVQGTLIGLVLSNEITRASKISLVCYNTEGTGIGVLDVWTYSGQPQGSSSGTGIDYPLVTDLPGNQYLVFYIEGDSNVRYYGGLQAHATYADTNPDSPFYVGELNEDGVPVGNGPIGTIRLVCMGGEYENIISDELALERAKLEIYWHCRLNDTITINTIPIPWLDVNILISHTPQNVPEGEGPYQYIVKSFTADYGDTNSMSITAMRYYPYYPEHQSL